MMWNKSQNRKYLQRSRYPRTTGQRTFENACWAKSQFLYAGTQLSPRIIVMQFACEHFSGSARASAHAMRWRALTAVELQPLSRVRHPLPYLITIASSRNALDALIPPIDSYRDARAHQTRPLSNQPTKKSRPAGHGQRNAIIIRSCGLRALLGDACEFMVNGTDDLRPATRALYKRR